MHLGSLKLLKLHIINMTKMHIRAYQFNFKKHNPVVLRKISFMSHDMHRNSFLLRLAAYSALLETFHCLLNREKH